MFGWGRHNDTNHTVNIYKMSNQLIAGNHNHFWNNGDIQLTIK